MNRKKMLANLKSLNINNAIADAHASADGSPAILLRWNGAEEYYTGFDIAAPGEAEEPEYQDWLIAQFADK